MGSLYFQILLRVSCDAKDWKSCLMADCSPFHPVGRNRKWCATLAEGVDWGKPNPQWLWGGPWDLSVPYTGCGILAHLWAWFLILCGLKKASRTTPGPAELPSLGSTPWWILQWEHSLFTAAAPLPLPVPGTMTFSTHLLNEWSNNTLEVLGPALSLLVC